MIKFTALVFFTFIVISSCQIFNEGLFLAGNFIEAQYFGNEFGYAPASVLYGPSRRDATPIVEEGTEPPVVFPPDEQAVQLNRKATAVPHNKEQYPSYSGSLRYFFR